MLDTCDPLRGCCLELPTIPVKLYRFPVQAAKTDHPRVTPVVEAKAANLTIWHDYRPPVEKLQCSRIDS